MGNENCLAAEQGTCMSREYWLATEEENRGSTPNPCDHCPRPLPVLVPERDPYDQTAEEFVDTQE